MITGMVIEMGGRSLWSTETGRWESRMKSGSNMGVIELNDSLTVQGSEVPMEVKGESGPSGQAESGGDTSPASHVGKELEAQMARQCQSSRREGWEMSVAMENGACRPRDGRGWIQIHVVVRPQRYSRDHPVDCVVQSSR